MKYFFPLLLLLFSIGVFAQGPPNVQVGSIDHNRTGREVATLLKTYATENKSILVVNDFGCDTDRFMSFDGQNLNTVFTANLDDFDYFVVAQHGNFVLIHDRRLGVLNTKILESNLSTGQTRTLFSSQAGGLNFSESIPGGYVYTDRNQDLHFTDGTVGGTTLLVADIGGVEAVRYGDRIVLATDTGYYITDGTAPGTTLLSSTASPGITDELIWNGDLFLLRGSTFFATDGTAAGSRFLHQPADNQFSFNLSATPAGLVFVSRTAAEGREIWTSDGTRAGTRILIALNPGTDDGVSSSFAIEYSDEVLLVRGGPTIDHNFLYRAAPTGLETIRDFTGAAESRWGINMFGQTDDQNLFITTSHLTDQEVLWRVPTSNQAIALDTLPRAAISPNKAFVRKNALLFLGGEQPDRLYYTNTSSTDITEVDSIGIDLPPFFLNDQNFNYTKTSVSNGFHDDLYEFDLNTGQLKTLGLYTTSANEIPPFFEFDDELFAVVLDSQRAEVIVNVDGNTPEYVTDLLPYTGSSSYDFMEAAGEYVYFIINQELFIAEPGTDSLRSLGVQVNDRTANQAIGSNIIFTIDNETILVASPTGAEFINLPTPFRSGRGDFALLNNELFFIANQSSNQHTRYYMGKISLSSLTTFETIFSFEEDVALDAWNGVNTSITVANGQLFFAFPSLTAGWELGVSDGTSSGTRLYEDLIPGTMSSSPLQLIGEGHKLALRTFRSIGTNNIFLFFLPQNRRFQYEITAWNDRLLQVSSNSTHTFLGISISTRSDNDLLIIEDGSMTSRTVPLRHNSDLLQLSGDRIGYWSDPTTLTTTTGNAPADSSYQNLGGSQGQSLFFADQFFYTAFRQNNSYLESIDLNTREQYIVDDASINSFVTYAKTSDRVYFPASSKLAGFEPHYLESSSLRAFSGIVFSDDNSDGILNGSDSLLEGTRILLLRNGSLFTSTTTNENGAFSFDVPSLGNFSILPDASSCNTITTTPSSYSIDATTLATTAFDFGLNSISDSLALRPMITVSATRCNEEGPVWINLQNTGCQALISSYNLTLPFGVTFVSADITPTSMNASELTWDNINLTSEGRWQNRITVRMPNQTSVGDTLTWNSTSSGLAANGNTVTTAVEQTSIVRCAVDPNDKQVRPARPEPSNSNYTQFDELVTYTIRFQNTGNATARLIRIEDQLSSNLDWQSFVPIGASHPYTYSVDDGGKLEVRFDNILLPDSSASLSMSQGYFSFDIKLKATSIGEQVTNEANIYFDANTPILTNEVSSSIVEFLDEDQDDFFFWDDCDDQNDMAYPGAVEIPDNGIDEDCDNEDASPVIDQSEIDGFSIYPNPSQGQLTITVSSPGDYLLKLYSVDGRLVKMQTLQRSTTFNDLEMRSGLYQVHLMHQESGQQASALVVFE